MDPRPVLAAIVGDVRSGTAPGVIAARFHRGVADVIVAAAESIRETAGLSTVGLSGGVFQNVTLTRAAKTMLGDAGFEVLVHRMVPPNDGGLALGQAVIATARR